jgi:transcriptional regulator with XRE-family HTH domain
MKDDAIKKKIGLAIRQLREAEGISQEELAFQSDLHRTYLGSVERGERNIAIINISKISKALGLSSAALLKHAGL